jgi:hypothetical protein
MGGRAGKRQHLIRKANQSWNTEIRFCRVGRIG